MPRKRLDINWDREVETEDLKPALKRYRRYLGDIGLRESTIESYVFRVGKYLEFVQTDAPSLEDFTRFRDKLHDERLSRSSINNYSFAIKGYHQMRGQAFSEIQSWQQKPWVRTTIFNPSIYLIPVVLGIRRAYDDMAPYDSNVAFLEENPCSECAHYKLDCKGSCRLTFASASQTCQKEARNALFSKVMSQDPVKYKLTSSPRAYSEAEIRQGSPIIDCRKDFTEIAPGKRYTWTNGKTVFEVGEYPQVKAGISAGMIAATEKANNEFLDRAKAEIEDVHKVPATKRAVLKDMGYNYVAKDGDKPRPIAETVTRISRWWVPAYSETALEYANQGD